MQPDAKHVMIYKLDQGAHEPLAHSLIKSLGRPASPRAARRAPPFELGAARPKEKPGGLTSRAMTIDATQMNTWKSHFGAEVRTTADRKGRWGSDRPRGWGSALSQRG